MTGFAVEGMLRADAGVGLEGGGTEFSVGAGQAAKLGACIFFGETRVAGSVRYVTRVARPAQADRYEHVWERVRGWNESPRDMEKDEYLGRASFN
jgi:hypothetical protein